MKSTSILVICMNPACPAPHLRCMDSRSLRTHPSDCSRHYFSVDTIINNKWTDIQDYPSDPTGISVSKKLNESKKDQHKKSNPYIVRMIQNFKQKICKSIDAFGQKFGTIIPTTSLQDLYITTYSLQNVGKNIQQGNNPQFISKILNSNFSKLRHGQLQLVNEKLNAVQSAFDNLLSGFRTQLKQIIDLLGVGKKNNNTQQVFRIEDGKLKPKIELGILKSKYIGSTKIQCTDGKIIFPKQNNIGSFLPWIYSERAFSSGIHQLRITSLKYPSVLNCGFTVLQQHDIDTYPYHFFKSLFSKQGKSFLPATLHNDGSLQSLQSNSEPKHEQIQYSINQVSQVILRLQLNSKPRAIIRNAQKSCFYVCKLTEGKQYRMGIYGSGWAINIKQLW